MKIFGSILALLMVVASIGCQTTQGQAGGGATTTAPAVSSAPAASSGGTLTDADYKRIGIREMYDLR